MRRYIEKMTGMSRAQVTRLIARYTASGQVRPTVYRRRCFPQRYTRADIELLASVDEAHETLSGPATRRILEREHQLYGKQEYARLAGISVAHLYNLRKSQRYRERRLNYVKTRPTTVSIGERRKPQPQGQPGYLRLDTVHQGDQPGGGAKGVYHINAVDEVTQWQVAGFDAAHQRSLSGACTGGYAAPVPLSHSRLPHRQRQRVHQRAPSPELLNKLLHRADQKPPPAERRQRPGRDQERRGDPQTHRLRLHRCGPCRPHQQLLSGVSQSYLNYHRPCAQAEVEIDEKGRKRVRYKRYQTPLETLLELDKPAQYLRQGLSINALKRIAGALSDTDAARRMQQAKSKLFEQAAAHRLGPKASGEGRGNGGLMEKTTGKSPLRLFHRPWKSKEPIPTFPRPGYDC